MGSGIIHLFRGYSHETVNREVDPETMLQLLDVCIPIASVFALINLSYGFFGLAIVLLVVAVTLSGFWWAIRRQIRIRFVNEILMVASVVVFVSLTIAGGIGDLGIFWSMGYPFIAFLIMGVRRGWLWVIAYALLIALVFVLSYAGLLVLPYSHQVELFAPTMFLFFTLLSAVLQSRNEKQAALLQEMNQQLNEHQRELQSLNASLENKVWDRTRQLQKTNARLSEEVLEKEKALQAMHTSEKKFEHAQRMEAVGTLVGGIAHDFNNMLSGITANLYMLQRHVKSDDAQKRLTTIGKLAMHAADMIQQLLTFARKDDVEMKRFDLRVFALEAYKLASVSISEHIRCERNFCRDALNIEGSGTQIQQMLMNLMNNARDALSDTDEPMIQVALQPAHVDEAFVAQHPEAQVGDYARLSVLDNGMGIASEKIGHIFEPFYTSKAVGKGTGLGLAMIYGAMQSHHGFVLVESRLGEGACFALYFPLCDSGDRMDEQHSSGVIRGNGESILLVDDDSELLTSNADLLRELGYEVLTACNGVQAVRMYEQMGDSVALTLMDVVMPELGGVAAAQKIWALDPHAAIIFVSGYDRDHDLTCELMPDGKQMLNKPLDVETLSRAIAEKIRGK